MNFLATWLPQLILVCIPLATGVLAYQTARKHRPDEAMPSVASGQPQPALNGSYAIIQACLERLRAVQTDYETLHTRYVRMEARLSECEAARKRIAASEGEEPTPLPTTPRDKPTRRTSRAPRRKAL